MAENNFESSTPVVVEGSSLNEQEPDQEDQLEGYTAAQANVEVPSAEEDNQENILAHTMS
jgi:hypothetical protein